MVQSGWEAVRARQSALTVAAAQAANGLDGVDERLARAGHRSTFPDRAALARYAQAEWWHRLLGGLDGELDDDLGCRSVEERSATAARAWRALRRQVPGYLALAGSCPQTPQMAADLGRFTRLLALYLGVADVDDPPGVAAAAGAVAVRAFDEPDRPPACTRGPGRWWRRRDRADGKLVAMRAAPALAACTRDDLVALARAADLLEADDGRALMTGAQPGTWWWFVVAGTVDAVVSGRTVRRVAAGDRLGPDAPGMRHVTRLDLVASPAAQVLVARRQDLGALVHTRPGLRAVLVPEATSRPTQDQRAPASPSTAASRRAG